MEKPAEDPLGNRPGGGREDSGPSPGESLRQDREAVWGRVVQLGDPRLSRENRRRKEGRPTGDRRGIRSGQRGVGVGRQGTRGAARTVEGGGRETWRRATVPFGHSYFLLSFFCLYFVTHFWRLASGQLQLGGSGATHP